MKYKCRWILTALAIFCVIILCTSSLWISYLISDEEPQVENDDNDMIIRAITYRNISLKDIQSQHEESLFIYLIALLEKPGSDWNKVMRDLVNPLLQNAPCYCPPCEASGSKAESMKNCSKVREYSNPSLKKEILKAEKQNLKSPFQAVPAAMHVTGGAWKPGQCKSKERIAIIIPFRDRWPQLLVLLEVLHPFLQRQQICYRVFVVEQYGSDAFNKGRLNNAGFLEAARRFQFDCVIFHDTDLIPFSDRNAYRCPSEHRPQHMITGLNTTKFKLPYYALVGGVIAFTVNQYVRLNGYSNLYWGWGLEDDDIELRMKLLKRFTRPTRERGFYFVQHHKRQHIYKIQRARRKPLLKTAVKRYRHDGLSTVTYKVIVERKAQAYTYLLLHIGDQPADFNIL